MYREVCLLLVIVLAADSTFAIGVESGPAVAFVPTKLPQLESVLNFPRCKKGDLAFGECLASAVQKVLPLLAPGIPALDFPALDPMYVGTIDLRCLKVNSTICVLLSSVVVRGFRNSRVLKITPCNTDNFCRRFGSHYCFHLQDTLNTALIHPDLENSRIAITVEVNVKFEAKYRMDAVNGKPLLSHGRCNITITKSQGTFTLTGKTVVRQGHTYLHFYITPLDIFHTESVTFYFDHLDDDPERNAAINMFINDNSMIIFQEIRCPWERKFGTHFNDLANIIFDAFPIDEIFLGD